MDKVPHYLLLFLLSSCATFEKIEYYSISGSEIDSRPLCANSTAIKTINLEFVLNYQPIKGNSLKEFERQVSVLRTQQQVFLETVLPMITYFGFTENFRRGYVAFPAISKPDLFLITHQFKPDAHYKYYYPDDALNLEPPAEIFLDSFKKNLFVFPSSKGHEPLIEDSYLIHKHAGKFGNWANFIKQNYFVVPNIDIEKFCEYDKDCEKILQAKRLLDVFDQNALELDTSLYSNFLIYGNGTSRIWDECLRKTNYQYDSYDFSGNQERLKNALERIDSFSKEKPTLASEDLLKIKSCFILSKVLATTKVEKVTSGTWVKIRLSLDPSSLCKYAQNNNNFNIN